MFPNNTSFSPSFTGTLTSGSNTVTGITYSGLSPGQTIGGNGIPGGTTITAVSAGSITLSAYATVTGTEQLNILSFNASFQNAALPTPSLAQRDKKINLNYPLPVSNDPIEPVRQKWISDTYQTLKAILPPLAVDSAEELAQLSQFVINIVDFRDTDATMTHWTNPDVYLRTDPTGMTSTYPFLAATTTVKPTTDLPLSQYGMEYNPIAINEVMAYSFASTPQTNRFYIELVNTLTSPELGTPTVAGLGNGLNNASVLDLAGFQSGGTPGPTTPWDGGCWDLVFTDDQPQNRPDPILGQLQVGGTQVGLIPLTTGTGGAMVANPALTPPLAPPAGDPVIFPLPQAMPPGGIATAATLSLLFQGYFSTTTYPLPWTYNPLAPYYFLTIGNPPANPATESAPPQPTYQLNSAWDPVNGTTAPSATVPPGVLPPPKVGQQPPTTYPTNKILNGKGPVPGSGNAPYFWVCLRRPANPFAAVSANNPMIVVDAMRFPFIESGPKATPNWLFSYQRLQPFRGGHAVPMPGVSGALDPRYGYSEQIAVPATWTTNGGVGGGPPPTAPGQFGHTLGGPNDAGGIPGGVASTGIAGTPNPNPPPLYTTNPKPPYLAEPWDYFPFNDRDFTSVAELLMVPGCPPGLFTKQFAEFAPSLSAVTGTFSLGSVKPFASLSTTQLSQQPTTTLGIFANTFNTVSSVTSTNPLTPHTFPYLVDKFFYTGASPATLPTNPTFGDQTADGWFKMFEFFEVPSQMIGAVGPVAQGTNFDWMRQDTKPGLINPNLIIDEEVFCSVFGSQDTNFTQLLLNFSQLPSLSITPSFQGASIVSSPTTFNNTTASATTLPMAAGNPPVPLVVTATTANGSPAAAYPMNNVGVVSYDPVNGYGNQMKAAFAQFLSLRHGGSGYVFGYGSGLPGQNMTVLPTTPNPNGPTTPAQAMVSPIPADRMFHSLAYPDIDYTIMRPAQLPPAVYPAPPATPTFQTDPPPNIPAATWPPNYNNATPNSYTADPGLRNSSIYQGFTSASLIAAPNTGTTPQSTPATTGAGTTPFLLPPMIAPRRLFQPPDLYWSTTAAAIPYAANTITASNASDTGDPYLNNLMPVHATAATGALAPYPGPTQKNNVVNLCWPNGATLPQTPPPPATGSTIANPYLGGNSNLTPTPTAGPPALPPPAIIDQKQHPYFRTEMLQKAMNLTTVRTHQYAVWITIGFFEVKRQGDLLMASTNTPWLAYDILGPELGDASGQTTRYRGFLVIDRLQLTGYDPNVIGSFRPAVVYRQTIE